MQVAREVVFSEEAGFTVVSVLSDVQRDAVELDAAAARHEYMRARKHSEHDPFNLAPLIRAFNSEL